MAAYDKTQPIFRVYWQSLLNMHSYFTYPAQAPYLTYDEAQAKSQMEKSTNTRRSWVVGPDGFEA